jgi:hypothetical protein
VIETRAAYSGAESARQLGGRPPGPSLFLLPRAGVTIGDATAGLALPGYSPDAPAEGLPSFARRRSLRLSAELASVPGSHDMRFGGAYAALFGSASPGDGRNAAQFLGLDPSDAFDNLVLGHAYRVTAAIDPRGQLPGAPVAIPASPAAPARATRSNEMALHARDNWRITPRFTASFGLRYDYFGPPRGRDALADVNFYPDAAADVFAAIRYGVVRPVDGRLHRPDRNNLGPTAGIAWDVFGDSGTVLRAGYSLVHKSPVAEASFALARHPLSASLVDLHAADVGGSIPIFAGGFGPLSTGPAREVPVDVYAVAPELRAPRVHLWNAIAERELPGRLLASVEYAGAKGAALLTLADVNRPFSAAAAGLPGGGPLARLNPSYGSLIVLTNDGASSFNAFNASVRAVDFADLGLSFTAMYSWSHAIDNVTTGIAEDRFNLGLLDPFHPELDRGDADADARHRLVSSGVWALPFGENADGLRKAAFDGWTVSFVFDARTGSPFSIYDCSAGFALCSRALLSGSVLAGGPVVSRRPANATKGNL